MLLMILKIKNSSSWLEKLVQIADNMGADLQNEKMQPLVAEIG